MTKAETDRLLAELEALPDYQGWTFVHVYPGFFSYRRGPISVYFTPDWEGDEILPIQVQNDEGHVDDEYSATLPLPRSGRTGQKLFKLVRPTLDKISKEAVQGNSAHHATKKSTAQLDREIAEVLARPLVQSPYSVHTPEWERDRTVRKLQRQKARAGRSHSTMQARGSYPFDLIPGDVVIRRDIKGRKKYRVSHLGHSGEFVQVYTRAVGSGGTGIVTFDRSQLRLAS